VPGGVSAGSETPGSSPPSSSVPDGCVPAAGRAPATDVSVSRCHRRATAAVMRTTAATTAATRRGAAPTRPFLLLARGTDDHQAAGPVSQGSRAAVAAGRRGRMLPRLLAGLASAVGSVRRSPRQEVREPGAPSANPAPSCGAEGHGTAHRSPEPPRRTRRRPAQRRSRADTADRSVQRRRDAQTAGPHPGSRSPPSDRYERGEAADHRPVRGARIDRPGRASHSP
jgi:hypothetical protein